MTPRVCHNVIDSQQWPFKIILFSFLFGGSKSTKTEAARLADPDYQREAASVSELKAAALGAPSASQKKGRSVSATGDVLVAVVVMVAMTES